MSGPGVGPGFGSMSPWVSKFIGTGTWVCIGTSGLGLGWWVGFAVVLLSWVTSCPVKGEVALVILWGSVEGEPEICSATMGSNVRDICGVLGCDPFLGIPGAVFASGCGVETHGFI